MFAQWYGKSGRRRWPQPALRWAGRRCWAAQRLRHSATTRQSQPGTKTKPSSHPLNTSVSYISQPTFVTCRTWIIFLRFGVVQRDPHCYWMRGGGCWCAVCGRKRRARSTRAPCSTRLPASVAGAPRPPSKSFVSMLQNTSVHLLVNLFISKTTFYRSNERGDCSKSLAAGPVGD